MLRDWRRSEYPVDPTEAEEMEMRSLAVMLFRAEDLLRMARPLAAMDSLSSAGIKLKRSDFCCHGKMMRLENQMEDSVMFFQNFAYQRVICESVGVNGSSLLQTAQDHFRLLRSFFNV